MRHPSIQAALEAYDAAQAVIDREIARLSRTPAIERDEYTDRAIDVLSFRSNRFDDDAAELYKIERKLDRATLVAPDAAIDVAEVPFK